MLNDNVWYGFSGLFVLAGLIHLARAFKRTGGKRTAGFALAGASVVWAATALTLRFVGIYPAMLVALAAVGLMLLAAVMSGRLQ